LLTVNEQIKKHIPQLELLFKRFEVENIFGVYILHRHFKVSEGLNLVGRPKTFDGRHCYWIRALTNAELKPSEVCGQKFIFDDQKGWLPCEFRENSGPDLRQVDSEFFSELGNYLNQHDLTSTFGLEYIVPELHLPDTLEFRLPNGELLLVPLVPSEVECLQANYAAATTSLRWSGQGSTSQNFCIPDENKNHPPPKEGDLPLPESQISINNLIEQQYPRIRGEVVGM
jgi:hypothetical protein